MWLLGQTAVGDLHHAPAPAVQTGEKFPAESPQGGETDIEQSEV